MFGTICNTRFFFFNGFERWRWVAKESGRLIHMTILVSLPWLKLLLSFLYKFVLFGGTRIFYSFLLLSYLTFICISSMYQELKNYNRDEKKKKCIFIVHNETLNICNASTSTVPCVSACILCKSYNIKNCMLMILLP